MCPSTKRCSSIFDLGPLTAKIYSQKFAQKLPISRIVWQIDRRCLGLTEFSGMADSMEPCKMLWANPCCRDNEIWASRGDQVAYRLIGCFFSRPCWQFFVTSHFGVKVQSDGRIKYPGSKTLTMLKVNQPKSQLTRIYFEIPGTKFRVS